MFGDEKMRNLKFDWGTDEKEFEHYVGRKPTKKEMDEWVHLVKKGVESQIDWEIIYQCASEQF